jgi:hypothetical protein
MCFWLNSNFSDNKWEQIIEEKKCPSPELTHCFKGRCEYSHHVHDPYERGFYIWGCAKENVCMTPKSRFWMNLCTKFVVSPWTHEEWHLVHPCFLCNENYTDLCNVDVNGAEIVAPKLLMLYNILLILLFAYFFLLIILIHF